MINALPAANAVTTENKTDIEAARATYDALDDSEKAAVTNYDKLASAETTLNKAFLDAYKTEKKTEAKDKEQNDDSEAAKGLIAVVVNVIESLAYDENRTIDENKAMVDAVISTLETGLAVQREVDAVITAINALPETTGITSNDKTTIQAVRTKYDALTDEGKAKVSADTLKKLTDAEAALKTAEDQAADAVSTTINALPASVDVTTENKAAIEAARVAYNALTDAQKGQVSADTLKRLTDAEDKLVILQAMSEVSAKTGSGMTYTGNPIQLINTPTTALPDGYSMKYAVTTTNEVPTDVDLYTTSIPTATDAGTYYVWYKAIGDENHNDTVAFCVTVTIAEPTSEEPEPEPEPASDDGSVAISEKDQAGNFADAGLENTAEELKASVLTDDDKAAMALGKDVAVWLEMKDNSASVANEDKTLVVNIVSQSLGSDYEVGTYLDLTLWKKVEDQDKVKVTEVPNGKVKVNMTVPENLRKAGATCKIIRIHNGVATVIDATVDETTWKLTFETNEFSTYALAYNSAANEEEESDWLEPFRTKLHIAGEASGAQTVEFEGGFALPREFMEYLKEHPQITLVYHVNYEGEEFTVTIPGSKVVVEENTDWYGPLGLRVQYAAGALARGTVTAPKTDDTLHGYSFWFILMAVGIAVGAAGFIRKKRGHTLNNTGKEFIERFRHWITDKFPKGWLKKAGAENILMIAGVVIVVTALFGLIYTVRQYSKSDRIYQDALNKFVVILPEEDDIDASSQKNDVNENKETSTEPDNGGKETEDREWYELASVDLEGLQAEYPDVAGWILFENEVISYPIVYSGDNETYIRTTCTGKKAEAGSIFMDGANTPDFTDPHTLIYGHNMKNLSMFGMLKYYKTEKNYYADHKYFQVFAAGKIYRYEIYAYCDIPADSMIYDVYGTDQENVLGLIKELKQKSYEDTGVPVGASDHIITLSTCTEDGDKRMIVSAVRVDEHVR